MNSIFPFSELSENTSVAKTILGCALKCVGRDISSKICSIASGLLKNVTTNTLHYI